MTQRKARKKYVMLFSTCGTQEEAFRIASHLVQQHLVACVNIVPSIRSVYWWNNQVNDEAEVLLIMKTEQFKTNQVENAIRSLHSYETPELICIKVEYGMPEYLSWIDPIHLRRRLRQAGNRVQVAVLLGGLLRKL